MTVVAHDFESAAVAAYVDQVLGPLGPEALEGAEDLVVVVFAVDGNILRAKRTTVVRELEEMSEAKAARRLEKPAPVGSRWVLVSAPEGHGVGLVSPLVRGGND